MYHVRVTFLLCSRGVSVTYSYGISLSYDGVSRRICYVLLTYVWRMQCSRDVSTAYELCQFHSYLRRISSVPNVFNTYENTLFMQFAHYCYELSEVEDTTEEILII